MSGLVVICRRTLVVMVTCRRTLVEVVTCKHTASVTVVEEICRHMAWEMVVVVTCSNKMVWTLV